MQGQPDIPVLTGLRFLAAGSVVLFHYRSDIASLLPAFGALEPLTSAGYLGVDLFFVLSGFILSYQYMHGFQRIERRSYLRFVGFRLARIYPLHFYTIVFLALPLLLARALGEPMSHPDSFSDGELVRNLLLVHAWTTTPIRELLSWNYPSWSISAEWFAYLLFPIIAFYITRVRSPLFLLLGAIGIVVFELWLGAAFGWGDIALIRLAGEFLMGCFIGRLFLIGWSPPWRWHLVSVACGVLVLAAAVILPVMGLDRTWVVVLFGPLILALARDPHAADRWLAKQPMVFLGEASFALYMTHAIIGDLGWNLLAAASVAAAPLAIRVGAVAMLLVVLVGVAAATFRVVERPSRRFVRRAIERSLSA